MTRILPTSKQNLPNHRLQHIPSLNLRIFFIMPRADHQLRILKLSTFFPEIHNLLISIKFAYFFFFFLRTFPYGNRMLHNNMPIELFDKSAKVIKFEITTTAALAFPITRSQSMTATAHKINTQSASEKQPTKNDSK